MGTTEVGGVPIPQDDRVWRHPSEAGQARRLDRHHRRRIVLAVVAWAVLLVTAAAVGHGALTD